MSGHPGKSYDETADAKIYLRTGANMCPPEIRNVQGKHNSFVTAKREYFYKQRRQLLHFTRVYTVCYGKKELQYFRKVYLTPFFLYNGLCQVRNCFKPESKNSLIIIQKLKLKRMSCELCLV